MLSIVGLLFLSISSFAQSPQPPHPPMHEDGEMDNSKKEKIKAMKVAYITEHLSLSPEEAEKFWPIYNEFEDKKEALRKERKKNRPKEKEETDNLSDKELESMIVQELEYKQQELDLEKEYFEKFKKVLTIRKVAKLHEVERSFKREMLRKLKDHHPGPQGGRH